MVRPAHWISASVPSPAYLACYQQLFQIVTSLSGDMSKDLETSPRACSAEAHWNLELGKNGFVGSVFCPTNPEHFPPAPHLKRVDALAVGFLEGPSLCAVEKNGKDEGGDELLFGIPRDVSVRPNTVHLGHSSLCHTDSPSEVLFGGSITSYDGAQINEILYDFQV